MTKKITTSLALNFVIYELNAAFNAIAPNLGDAGKIWDTLTVTPADVFKPSRRNTASSQLVEISLNKPGMQDILQVVGDGANSALLKVFRGMELESVTEVIFEAEADIFDMTRRVVEAMPENCFFSAPRAEVMKLALAAAHANYFYITEEHPELEAPFSREEIREMEANALKVCKEVAEMVEAGKLGNAYVQAGALGIVVTNLDDVDSIRARVNLSQIHRGLVEVDVYSEEGSSVKHNLSALSLTSQKLAHFIKRVLYIK